MKRLKHLEDENGRLKHILTNLSLDKEMLQNVIKRKLRGPTTNSGAPLPHKVMKAAVCCMKVA